MKISVFTDSFLPYISGVSFAVLNQMNEMAARGHEISIFRPKPSRGKEEGFAELHPAIHICDIPISIPNRRLPDFTFAIPSFVSSYQEARKFRPDIIHVHSEWGCGWEGLTVSRLLGIPCVGTFHTFYAEPEYLKHFYLPDFRATKELMWRYSIFFYNQCHTVISPSHSVKMELVEKGVGRRPVILSNGIVEPVLLPDEAIRKKRAELGIHGPSMVYVGRVAEEKSLDVVVRAFAYLHRKLPQARFVLVGDGPADAKIDETIKREGVQDAVLRLGSISHDRLMEENIPRLGDVFVTASKTENQPISILEAMMFGLPVVGVRAKGIPELVHNGVNGFLCEPDRHEEMAEAVLRIIDTPSLLNRMSQAARRHGERNGIRQVGHQLERVYHRTIRKYQKWKRRDNRRMLGP